MAKITLGVTGSVAVQKIPQLIRLLQERGHELFVVMTKSAGAFGFNEEIEGLVGSDHFYDYHITDEATDAITHIYLAQEVDLLAIIPATFNSINKYALGIADDLLGSIVAARTVKMVIAPAMNTFMYQKPVLQRSMRALYEEEVGFIYPATGMLACGYEGIGKLAPLDELVYGIEMHLQAGERLKGKKVLISSGTTRVYLDPIRYIANTSSGKMGYELARQAKLMGADVTLVNGPNQMPKIYGITYVDVETPEQMHQAMLNAFADSDYVFMSAAVSDYKPKEISDSKIKKADDDLQLELARSIDILKDLGSKKTTQKLIGFAAEDRNHEVNAQNKLVKKNLDYIVLNDLSHFGSDENAVKIIDKANNIVEVKQAAKAAVAQKIIETVI